VYTAGIQNLFPTCNLHSPLNHDFEKPVAVALIGCQAVMSINNWWLTANNLHD